MPTFLTEDPASFAMTESEYRVGKYRLGGYYVDKSGRTFRFLKLTDAIIAKNGFVAEWASTTNGGIVTVDRVGGSSLGRVPACVFMGTVNPAIPYFFGLTRGLHDNVFNGAWPTQNLAGTFQKMVSHPTTDGGAYISSIGYAENFFGVNRAQINQAGPVDVEL